MRRRPYGIEGLSRQIAEALQARGLIESRLASAGLNQGSESWYEGRPVMVTRNDYSLGLSNGDVSICLRFPDGEGGARLAVAFPVSTTPRATGDARVRRILPSRLNEVTTAYAMTVHKPQGSEFEHTLLALPLEPSPLLTRELLYTGSGRDGIQDWRNVYPVVETRNGVKDRRWNTRLRPPAWSRRLDRSL